MKAIVVVWFLCGTPAWGWSVEGHRTIAAIADAIVQKSAAYAQIEAILGDLTLSDIATCPDELRELQRNSKMTMSASCQKVVAESPPRATATWHYIDIPVSIDIPSESDLEKLWRQKPCVIDEIVLYGAVLADQSKSNAFKHSPSSFTS